MYFGFISADKGSLFQQPPSPVQKQEMLTV